MNSLLICGTANMRETATALRTRLHNDDPAISVLACELESFKQLVSVLRPGERFTATVGKSALCGKNLIVHETKAGALFRTAMAAELGLVGVFFDDSVLLEFRG